MSTAAAMGRAEDGFAQSYAEARQKFLRERPSSHLAERMRQICREIE